MESRSSKNFSFYKLSNFPIFPTTRIVFHQCFSLKKLHYEKIYFYIFVYVYFQPFLGLLWTIHFWVCNVMRLGFWRTLQSSKVLNTVFTTSVLVVIFLHSLRVSKSASACPDLQREKKTHSRHHHNLLRPISTRSLKIFEFLNFQIFQKIQNLGKKFRDLSEIF